MQLPGEDAVAQVELTAKVLEAVIAGEPVLILGRRYALAPEGSTVVAEVELLRLAIGRARARHGPVTYQPTAPLSGGWPVGPERTDCRECYDQDGNAVEYPCPTIEDLELSQT